jgi:hypothetical protein
MALPRENLLGVSSASKIINPPMIFFTIKDCPINLSLNLSPSIMGMEHYLLYLT